MTKREIDTFQRQVQSDKPIMMLQSNGGAEGQPNNNYSWSRDLPPFLTETLVKELSKKYHIYHL